MCAANFIGCLSRMSRHPHSTRLMIPLICKFALPIWKGTGCGDDFMSCRTFLSFTSRYMAMVRSGENNCSSNSCFCCNVNQLKLIVLFKSELTPVPAMELSQYCAKPLKIEQRLSDLRTAVQLCVTDLHLIIQTIMAYSVWFGTVQGD